MLVGALSWNPERIRSLAERGHQLWGCWTRSMPWDQGPYPALDDCLERVMPEDAPRVVAEHRVDCVYALFQVYEEGLWAPAANGVDDDVWTVLRRLLSARADGDFDLPFVFHWGFDVHTLDEPVVRALDGHIFCNREQHAWWTTPSDEGGCGLDVFDEARTVAFLDGDRPKAEFMGDDVAELLSARTGELHTVCAGRPFNIDAVQLARRGIHLHVYGNGFDDVAELIARDAIQRGSGRDLRRVHDHVHFHPSLQPDGRTWPEVRATKARWVHEFSRYDAGWSYIGRPFPWKPLEDRAAIPNRLSTYVLAGLPVISDHRPGAYRYDELARLGALLELLDDDYDALHAALQAEATSGTRRANALAARHGYSFDASIDDLVGVLERAHDRYFALPPTERRRPVARQEPLITPGSRPSTTAPAPKPGFATRARNRIVRRIRTHQVRRLARSLLP